MATTEKHVAVYLRVSSRSQDTRSQEPDLKRWAEAQDQLVRWYRDKASGKSMERPGWARLQKDLDAGSVSRIVVWRLDRLGRTVAGLAKLFDELTSRKIGLVSLKDGVDLQTAAGRLMCNVVASVSQYETEIRAERVRAGQAAARAQGVTWGGSEAGKRKVVTDEQVRVIRQLHQEGTKIARIARTVGLSRPTVYSVLQSK